MAHPYSAAYATASTRTTAGPSPAVSGSGPLVKRNVDRAMMPDGTVNPHMLYLPESRYFDPGVARPSPYDGVGPYMRPSKFSEPQYKDVSAASRAAAGTEDANDVGARERTERQLEHTRLVEYRKRLGVDGPARVPDHLRNYQPPDRPKYVPYIVRSNPYRTVKWEPPVAEPERPVDISTADAVEVPARAAGRVSDSPEQRRRIVAYDDGDPFPFPVRTVPPPPPDVGAPSMESFGPGGLTPVHTATKLMLFTPNRSRVYQLQVGSPGDGWSTLLLHGDFPGPDSILTLLSPTHIVAFERGDRCHALTLQNMTWSRIAVPKYRLTDIPNFAHTVGTEMQVYVRTYREHYVLTFDKFEVLEGEEVRAGDETMAIRRFRLFVAVTKLLRSTPTEENLVPVPFAPGIAAATTTGRRGEVHTWIFKYEPTGLNWLPHERIEFGHPLGVVLGRKVLFFAVDSTPESLYALGGKYDEERGAGICVVATMQIDNGQVKQPPTSGDVRLMLKPSDVLCLTPTRRADNAVLCVTSDYASYMVLEVDRWEKIKSYVFNGEHDYDSKFTPDMVR
jgi:hypothetical protein